MTAKRTDPPRHLYAGHVYTPSHATNIRILFDRVRAEQSPASAKNVATIRRKSAK